MFPFTSHATRIRTLPDALASRAALVARLEGALRAAGATGLEITASTVRFTGTSLDIRRLGWTPRALQAIWEGTVHLEVASAGPGATCVRSTVALRYSPALWVAAGAPGLLTTAIAATLLSALGHSGWWALVVPVLQGLFLAWNMPRATVALVEDAVAGQTVVQPHARAV